MFFDRNVLCNGTGFEIIDAFTVEELESMRNYVLSSLHRLLLRENALSPAEIQDLSFDNYHLSSSKFDHKLIFSRRNRLFNEFGLQLLYQSDLWRKITEDFSNCSITNEIHRAKPEVVWRIVRPFEAGDVGPLHADSWFWSINSWTIPRHRVCTKFWILLNGGEGPSGLVVAPGSQLDSGRMFDVVQADGIFKPVIKKSIPDDQLEYLYIKTGQGVMFSYDLVHGGAVTQANSSRVSIEFTIESDKE